MLPGFYDASQQDVVDWLGEYEQSFAGLSNTRSFVAHGTGHVVMAATDDETTAALSSWLMQMVTDDPAWRDVFDGHTTSLPVRTWQWAWVLAARLP